jgi:ATP-dependent DNA helicase RecG
VVIFPSGPGGDELIEKTFHGPIHEQVRAALKYLKNNLIREKVVKHRDRAESTRIFNYPFSAIEESLVNAVYHRSYESREPVEVRVSPDGIEIVSVGRFFWSSCRFIPTCQGYRPKIRPMFSIKRRGGS